VGARAAGALVLDMLIETRRLRVVRVAEAGARGPAHDLFRIEDGALRQVEDPSSLLSGSSRPAPRREVGRPGAR
jgi:hypothetical protein